MDEIKELIKFLLEQFKIERYLYLASTTLSTVCLMGTAGYLFYKGEDYKLIFALFGPTGVIAYTGSKILTIWTDCISLIDKHYSNNEK